MRTLQRNARNAGKEGIGDAEWARRVVQGVGREMWAFTIGLDILKKGQAHMVREGLRHLPFPKPTGVGVLDKKKHLRIEVLKVLDDLPGPAD